MSVSSQPEIDLAVTPNAGVEVKKFMDAEGVTAEQGGLRVSVQPGAAAASSTASSSKTAPRKTTSSSRVKASTYSLIRSRLNT